MVNMDELSVMKVAKITKKKPETVRKWIHAGKLKARKPPFCRDFIIYKDDFERFWYGENPAETEKGTSRQAATE